MIVDKSSTPNKVVLLELTVPFDSAHLFEAARDRKVQWYERLALEIKEKGCTVLNCPLDIGCSRMINARNRGVMATLAGMGNIKDVKNLSRTVKIAPIESKATQTLRTIHFLKSGVFMRFEEL